MSFTARHFELLRQAKHSGLTARRVRANCWRVPSRSRPNLIHFVTDTGLCSCEQFRFNNECVHGSLVIWKQRHDDPDYFMEWAADLKRESVRRSQPAPFKPLKLAVEVTEEALAHAPF